MQDDLRWNKLFGAALGTGLLILVLRQGAEMAFAPAPPPKKPGYAITVQESGGEGEAVVADAPVDWGTVLPAADVAAGETISTKCQSCHNFAQGGPNQTGPNLWGVEGRKPGSHPGFAYSGSMTDFGGKHPLWTYDELYGFLAGPQAYVSGTKMSFVGLKKREDRINVIAWLRTQGGALPVPAPDPARAAGAAPAAAAGSAPAPAAGTTVPADAAAGAKEPVAAAAGAPADATTANPTGQTPASGAAAAPTAIGSSAPGGGPSPKK